MVQDLPISCTICQDDSIDELQCSRCKYSLHYICALGFDPPEELKASESKVDFICPTCVSGSSYDLLHLALEAHSKRPATAPGTPPSSPVSYRGVSPVLGNTSHNHMDDTPLHSAVGAGANPERDATRRDAGGQPPAAVTEDNQRSSESGGTGARPGSQPGAPPRREQPPSILPDPNMAPPHGACIGRAKKFHYLLGTLRRGPLHPNTFVGGDSHLTGVDGKEIDSTDDQVRVRSAGGLCIIAAVLALLKFTTTYKNFKRVVWVLGTNDATHINQHCVDDRVKYIRLLYKESVRIFPNAVISFIVPFSGLRGVSESFKTELIKDLKFAAPKMKVILPPSVRNKISTKGLHLNREGRGVFLSFLRSKFVQPKQRTFSKESGKGPQITASNAPLVAMQQLPTVPNPPVNPPATVNSDNFRVPPARTNHEAPPAAANCFHEQGAPPWFSHGQLQLANHNHLIQVQDITARVVADIMKQQRLPYHYLPPAPAGVGNLRLY